MAWNFKKITIFDDQSHHETPTFNLHTHRSARSGRSFAQIKYRLYAFFIAFLALITLVSDNYNIVPVSLTGFNILSQNIFASKVQDKRSASKSVVASSVIIKGDNKTYVDEFGNAIDPNDVANESTFNLEPSIQIGNNGASFVQPLDDVIPKPANPVRRNFLYYPKYNINAPIVFSSPGDFDKKVQGAPCSAESQNTPIQQLLKSGIVHMYFSPRPGELYDPSKGHQSTTSYIVGHSSDCTSHAYSTIFRPLQQKSQPGEEFTIWDEFGREMKFKVFEAKSISDTDLVEAYGRQDFVGRRIVTLQTSIYINANRIDRWLTRGELEQ